MFTCWIFHFLKIKYITVSTLEAFKKFQPYEEHVLSAKEK